MADDDASGLPPGMSVLWRRAEERSRPGRRPGLTLDAIAAAGIALADDDGLVAVSMARVAERLGVTTMALYRYVSGKDELLAVMYDTALPAPPSDPADDDVPWRTRLERWCRAQLALLHEHPWVVELSGLPPVGPNRVDWIERGLEALAGTPLPRGTRVALLGMLSLHLLTEGQLVAAFAQQEAGRGTGGHPALVDYGSLLRAVADPVSHPLVHAAATGGAFDGDGDDADQDELALAVLLDGVEALVARCAEATR